MARTKKLPNHALDESGDPNNDDRSAWAEAGLHAFASETGQIPGIEIEDIVCDFLADLGHFCDRYKIRMPDMLRRAEGHYETETQGYGTQFDAANPKPHTKPNPGLTAMANHPGWKS